VLYAQPIVDLATGSTVQHELLLRMITANGEVIAPGRFLPVAEQLGLATAIDRRVFDMALVHAAAGFRVAVNLSADSVRDPGLFRFVEDRLRANAVDPRMVIFEITETALIHNEAVAQAFIEKVRGLNCAVALDDFGTVAGPGARAPRRDATGSARARRTRSSPTPTSNPSGAPARRRTTRPAPCPATLDGRRVARQPRHFRIPAHLCHHRLPGADVSAVRSR